MNLTVEKLEKNMAKLTVEVGADVFEAAIKTVYNKQKGQISVPGFRKGKVPQAYLEKMYGAEMFYEDAANEVISNEYPKVFDETDLEIVSSPEVEVVQAKKGEPFIFTATYLLHVPYRRNPPWKPPYPKKPYLCILTSPRILTSSVSRIIYRILL